MRPVLGEVLGWQVPAYGLTFVTMIIAGLALLRREARGIGLTDAHILDLGMIAVATIWGWTVGGYVLARAHLAASAHVSAIPILALGAFAFLFYMRRKGLPAELIFDRIAPIAALALAVQFGIGTFLAGTAFGWPTRLPWGVSFPPGSPAYRAFGAEPLHPTQLYLGAGFLLIAIVAWWSRDKLTPGVCALLTFQAIALWYLTISPFRAMQSMFRGGLPRASEVAAALALIVCATMLHRVRKPP